MVVTAGLFNPASSVHQRPIPQFTGHSKFSDIHLKAAPALRRPSSKLKVSQVARQPSQASNGTMPRPAEEKVARSI